MEKATIVSLKKTTCIDASLDFHNELQRCIDRLGTEKTGSPHRFAAVGLISRLLFLRFLDESGMLGNEFASSGKIAANLDHKPNGPIALAVDGMVKFDPILLQVTDANHLSLNSQRVSAALDELLTNYSWALTGLAAGDHQTKPNVRPWILSFVYERLISNRETGSYFTPDTMADSIVQHALEEWITLQHQSALVLRHPVEKVLGCWHRKDIEEASDFKDDFEWLENALTNIRVLDLSVGGGAFLVAASKLIFGFVLFCRSVLGKHSDGESLLHGIYERSIYGVDIQDEAIQIAKMRLWLLGAELNAIKSVEALPSLPNLLQSNALSPIRDIRAAQLPFIADQSCSAISEFLLDRGGFDICVGNPPFIALSQENHVPGKLEFIDYWNGIHQRYRVRTTSDLSNFFILRGIEVLRPNGVLAYITSRNFFDTRYGDPIRRFLTEQVQLRHIFTLHEHPFVQNGLKVKANTVILSVARRTPSGSPRFHHLMSWQEHLSNTAGREIDRARLRVSQNWTQTLFQHDLQKELEARCPGRLSSFATARMGTKSGCNAFFLAQSQALDSSSRPMPKHLWARIVKNSREIRGFILPDDPPHRILNLHRRVRRVEDGYNDNPRLDSLARFIFERGIAYPCEECQSMAAIEHKYSPGLFPHSGMCAQCSVCRAKGENCDRPVDRKSTQGHRPEWYTLALDKPPQIAVQCIVDTEIGVFWNQPRVFVNDQFQVIESSASRELDALVFLFLLSRISHLLMEGIGLHRARYDGSFMLKIQVSHLDNLPCPDLDSLSTVQRDRLLRLFGLVDGIQDRKSDAATELRDEIDSIFLQILGYGEQEAHKVQAELKSALDKAIMFRWQKTDMRETCSQPNGGHRGNRN